MARIVTARKKNDRVVTEFEAKLAMVRVELVDISRVLYKEKRR